ncbi:hypothetical protein JXB27_00735 [Candidatus Woesearchaeota archaeon]|nr:hypothetical protein [Candidatus Woesearchaeota archaeon]
MTYSYCFKMIEQTYLQRFSTDPETFLGQILVPSIDLILIGEDHFKPIHAKNEFRLIEEAIRTRGRVQIGIEYMDSRDSALFKNGSRTQILNEIEKVYGHDSDESRAIIPKVEFALDRHLPVIPLSLDERAGEYDNLEKENHISGELSRITNRDILTLALLGNAHLSLPERELIPSLKYPKERTVCVLQNTEYAPGIETVFGKDRLTFRLNQWL